MLETRNLVKIYRPKKGVPVTALNDVSLKFPDTGMVFLLGKSGSGKSTLLNVLGGLDRYDGGEILIKGKSSKTFRQEDFDSYRNTYVGFIFQEYNILDEFSVGANIALALQLQGIKPTDAQINEILRQVDLDGYGVRKPNELSGGQKQRVAIARALVKSPKIIMADEPTGALDSATGRQILSTLKKLSADKLVIVVSHDREFAEQYGDRIIELADGKVIRDVQRSDEPVQELPAPVYGEDSISLPQSYHLTQEDEKAICDYIQRMINRGEPPKIQLQGSRADSNFRPTDPATIQSSQDGYHLIKSRLPMKYAFRMGVSALKHKKFRLVMTILLSCVAFILFGLADTMASYDYVTTSVSSLTHPDSQIFYAAFEKKQEVTPNPEFSDYSYFEYDRMNPEDYDLIRQETGLTVYPVFANAATWMSGFYLDMDFIGNLTPPENPDELYRLYDSYYSTGFGGYVEISQSLLEDMGAKIIAGRLPEAGKDELVVSTYILETFQKYGHCQSGTNTAISSAQDLIGKQLTLDGIEYTVCGVADTGIDYSRYDSLKEPLDETAEFTDQLLRMTLLQELQYSLNYSLTGLAMVSQGQIERINTFLSQNRDYYNFFYLHGDGDFAQRADFGTLDQVDPDSIVWLDGKVRTQLQDNEILLSEDVYTNGIRYSEVQSDKLNFTMQYQSEHPDYSEIMALELVLDIYPTGNYKGESQDVKIVGILPNQMGVMSRYSHVVSQTIMDRANIDPTPLICQTIAVMPQDRDQIQAIVEFSDREFTMSDGSVCNFALQNPVSFELKMLDEVFEVLRKVFLGIGLAFVIFACLLFSNFIATSISYKKREIGILRAIGSRSNDVFRIFFAESFVIAMINFVVSLLGTAAICGAVNSSFRNQVGLLLTVLTLGPRQGVLLFAICMVCAAAASFLPVRRIAAKRPIDAIRDR